MRTPEACVGSLSWSLARECPAAAPCLTEAVSAYSTHVMARHMPSHMVHLLFPERGELMGECR